MQKPNEMEKACVAVRVWCKVKSMFIVLDLRPLLMINQLETFSAAFWRLDILLTDAR